MIDTEYLKDDKNRKFIVIRKYIQGKPFNFKNEYNEKIKYQIEEIIRINKNMIRDGYVSIDLTGINGLFNSKLNNILIDKDDELKIIDTTLMEGKSILPFGIFVEIISFFVKIKQNYLFKKFLLNK